MPVFRQKASPAVAYAGLGYIGGDAPTSNEPDAPDGRAKRLNVPSRVRITVLDRGSLRVVGATISAADGTWRVPYLSLAFTYLVLGQDELGRVNAATQDWVQPALMED